MATKYQPKCDVLIKSIGDSVFSISSFLAYKTQISQKTCLNKETNLKKILLKAKKVAAK